MSVGSEWPLVKLGNLCEISIGKTPSRKNPEYWGPGHPWLSIRDMNQGRKLLHTAETITDRAITDGNMQLRFPGTILFSFKLSIGKVGIAGVPLYTNEAIAALLPISEDRIDRVYLSHFLQFLGPSLTGNRAVMGITLNKKTLAEILVPLPSLEEQKRIAKILDTAAKTKEKAYTALKRLDASRTNAVNECLKNENSQKRPLSDFTDIRSGITKGRKVPTDTKLSSIPYLAVSNVKDGYLDLDVVKTIDVTPREAEKFSLSYGDILLTEGGDPDKLGRGTVWKDEIENCIHQNHVFRVRLETDSPLTSQVLMAILSSNPLRSYFFRSAKQTTGIASINRTQLAAAPIPILSSTQVAKLDSILTSFDQVQALLKQRIKSLEELQNSLQTRAFQGLL
ncbi:restriction endonuclease subunit S [Corynebacterium glutamicum]|uniref:restriction endonuclease subunit S n=1 Tax=Corynebacterium glutamicum TaxID=1718 RepID=UPI001467B583|nr:restriction endonuclease subunit S [Corynebacterium glutamicum]GFK20094.1 hypothetical protein KbCgl_26660 [Corynebacterium glutamicum]